MRVIKISERGVPVRREEGNVFCLVCRKCDGSYPLKGRKTKEEARV